MHAPSFATGDNYCAVGNKLVVGSYGYPTGTTQFYVSGNSVFTGNATLGGNLFVSGTLSGAGFDSLLSPDALKASVPPPYYTASPLLGSLQLTGANAGQVQLSLDSTKALTCAGLTSSSGLNVSSGNATIAGTLNCGVLTTVGNSVFSGGFLTTQAIFCTSVTASGEIFTSAGGLSVVGSSSITGTLTSSDKLTVGANGIAITGNSSITGTLACSILNNPGSLKQVGLTCTSDFTSTGKTCILGLS